MSYINMSHFPSEYQNLKCNTHTHTFGRKKCNSSEVSLRLSGKQMGEKKEKHDCIFISSVERKSTRVKRDGDGRYEIEASFFQTVMCDWDYPYTKYIDVFE